MSIVKLTTVEGHEIELDGADHAKLMAWPDLDLAQIHVVGDDALHALKPSTGRLHTLTLEEMLNTPTKECNGCKRAMPIFVFPTSGTSGGYRNTCASCRSSARRARRQADAEALEASLVAPVTGEPKGMLKRYVEREAAKAAKAAPRLHVNLKGEQRPAPPAVIGEHFTRVPLCTPAMEFAGFAKVDTAAFRAITRPPVNADRILWFLHPGGYVTLKALDAQGVVRIRRLHMLLREQGLSDTLEIERMEYPG